MAPAAPHAREPRTIWEMAMEIIRTSGLATLIVCGLLWWFYHDASPVLLGNLKTQTETQQQQATTLDRLTKTLEHQEQTHQVQLEILKDLRDTVKVRAYGLTPGATPARKEGGA